MKKYIFLLAMVVIFTGCETIEEEAVLDDNDIVNDDYSPDTNNSGGVETPYGYIGDGLYFGDYEVVSGVWSVYLKRSEYDNYNAYMMGLDMYSNGKLGYQVTTPGYKSNIYEWAVSEDSSTLTISPIYKFKIVGEFTRGEQNCYKITGFDTGEEGKICNETLVNQPYVQNSLGYIGKDVVFGNYSKGNVAVVGDWQQYKIVDGEPSSTPDFTFVLNEDGSVTGYADTNSTDLLWGVSADGKSLFIGETKMLVYRYLDEKCFSLFTSKNDMQTGEVKLCKVN
jgi:hypothetical protein